MTTAPSFIHLSRPKRPGTASLEDLDEDLLYKQNFDKDEALDKSTWGMQPGVWWKDDNKWVLYDRKIARRILKAREIGVAKVRFNRAASESSQYTSANTSPHSSVLNIDESLNSTVSDSFGSSSSRSPTEAPEFEVDLVNMNEVHFKSGKSREIKIVTVSLIGCFFLTLSTPNDTGAKHFIAFKKASSKISQNMDRKRAEVVKAGVVAVEEDEKIRVSWKDEAEGWCSYDDDFQKAIWSAWTAGESFVTIENLKSMLHPSGTKNIIDLKAMQQTDLVTGDKRSIKIAMWIPSSKFSHMWTGENLKSGDVEFNGNEIMLHNLALSRLLSPEYVRQAVSKNMEHHLLRSLEMNTDLAESGHCNSFLQSFMQRVREIPDYSGHLWRFALNPNGRHHAENPFSSGNSNVLWRFVFGAPSHEGDILRKSGANALPFRYDTHIDWFGLSTTITEFHCKPVQDGCVSMLVFLAMMPKNFLESRERVVFLKKIKDYLPVASITVSIDDKAFGPACSLWEERSKENSPIPSSLDPHLSSISRESQRWRHSVMFQHQFSPTKFL